MKPPDKSAALRRIGETLAVAPADRSSRRSRNGLSDAATAVCWSPPDWRAMPIEPMSPVGRADIADGVDHSCQAVRQVMQDALGSPLWGLMIGQNGMSSTLNAWLLSALLGTKVVDAVGDIRAHPTGDMGAIGMAASPEATIQTAVGGHRLSHSYIELVVRGATAKVSPILRKAADLSGGFIASCRNPVRASYVRTHAALGGISRALALGRAILDAEPKGGKSVVEAICSATSGEIVGTGRVTRKSVVYTDAAFDIGRIAVRCGARDLVLHVMNEYMAIEDGDGRRLAHFQT